MSGTGGHARAFQGLMAEERRNHERSRKLAHAHARVNTNADADADVGAGAGAGAGGAHDQADAKTTAGNWN